VGIFLFGVIRFAGLSHDKVYGTEGPGMAPVSNRISSKVGVPPVGVLAPICTESARVVNV
jgi:hypothetical protein